MSPPRSPDQAPTQSAPVRARNLCVRLVLWLASPLVVYAAADGWPDLTAARHSADLVHFHALDTAARMINGQTEWDEGRLRVSVSPATLTVFAVSETPVRDQVTYQVSTEHGCLLAGRLDFGMCPAFDATGLTDTGTYTDTVEGQLVHVAVVVRTMYDAGHTEHVVTYIA